MLWYNNTTEVVHPKLCVFGDLTGIVPVDCHPQPGASFMEQVYAFNRAPLYSKQHCYTHNKCCSLGLVSGIPPDFDLSGLPCPDMSPCGLRQGLEGPTAQVFIAHAKHHIALQTPLLVIENVPDWASEICCQTIFTIDFNIF